MITPEILQQILRRVDSEEMIFDYDEIKKWSKDTRSQLIALKLLHRAAPAPSYDCCKCERICLALPVKRDEMRQPYIDCPKHIRVYILNKTLDRYQVDINEIALRLACGLDSQYVTRITNHLWMVGQVDTDAMRTSVFLARGLRRSLVDNSPPILDIPIDQPAVVIVPNLRNYENPSSRVQDMVTLDEVLVLSNGNISVCISAIHKAANRVQARLAGTTATQNEPRYLFIQGKDNWIIVYDDVEVQPPLRSTKGLEYLAYLLFNPSYEGHLALDILNIVNNPPLTPNSYYAQMDKNQLGGEGLSKQDDESKDEIFDKLAEQEYMKELKDDLAELQFAQASNSRGQNTDRILLLERNIEAYEHQLREGIGLYGQHRSFSNNKEKARSAVSTAIRRVLKVLDELSTRQVIYKPLYVHLKGCVHLGVKCRYHPDTQIPWNHRLEP